MRSEPSSDNCSHCYRCRDNCDSGHRALASNGSLSRTNAEVMVPVLALLTVPRVPHVCPSLHPTTRVGGNCRWGLARPTDSAARPTLRVP